MSSPAAVAPYHPHPAESPGGGFEKRRKLNDDDDDEPNGNGAPPMGGPPPPGAYPPHGYYAPPPGAAGSPGGGMGGPPPPGYGYPPPPGAHDPYYRGPPPGAHEGYYPPPPGHYGAPPPTPPHGAPSPHHHGMGHSPRHGPPRAHLPPRLGGYHGGPQFQDYVHRPGKGHPLQPPTPGHAATSPGNGEVKEEEEQRSDARSPEGSRNLNNFEERVPSTDQAHQASPEGSPAGPRAVGPPTPIKTEQFMQPGLYPGPPTPSMGAGMHGPPTPSMHGMPPGMPYGHPGYGPPPPSPYGGPPTPHFHPGAHPSYPGPPTPHGHPGYPGPPTPHGHHHHPGMPQFMPPGSGMPPAPQGPGGDAWPCEYCGLKFPNWEDCSAHEQSCAAYHQHAPPGYGYPGLASPYKNGHLQSPGRAPRNRSLKGRKMALASFPNQGHLMMDENAEFATNTDRDTYLLSAKDDGESLSDRQCYVRSHFVELFVSNAGDVSARHSRGAQKLHLNQIGLRCAYCVKLKPRDRAERAICYPSSISRIYQTVADMQRFHFESCVAIPPKVLHTYKSLKTTRPRGVGSPQSYWDKSARDIGLVDTENGIQVAEEGKARLEGQKKSPVTGLLASLGGPEQPPSMEGHPGMDGQGMGMEQGMHHGPMGGMDIQVPIQGGPAPVHHGPSPVKEEPHNPGPQDQTIAHSGSAPGPNGGMPSAVVVSSPGSTSTGKEEDVGTPGAGQATDGSKPASSEDANILLMLKKTPESPQEGHEKEEIKHVAV